MGAPLLIIPFAIYNLLAFLLSYSWTNELWPITLSSGIKVTPTAGDALVAGSILILMFELVKAARRRSVVDHLLSLILFVGMIVEFLMVKEAATTAFLLLLVISFVDVAGGFAITVRTARRNVNVTEVEHVHPG